jgi:hypothetical protein
MDVEPADDPGPPTAGTGAGPPWWASFPFLLGVSVVLALALVPWRYLASEDGPSNLASARIMAGYPGAFEPYFILDVAPKFNTLWQILLVVPTSVLPPLVGERILVVALFVALPVAGWYAATGIRAGAGPVAFLLLPISMGFFFHAGYFGFCLGVVLGVVSMGWWLRHRDGGWGSSAVLAGLLVLTYLAHIIPAGMVVLLAGVVTLWEVAVGERSRSLRRLLWLGAAAVPFLVLFVAFSAPSSDGSAGIRFVPSTQLITDLFTFTGVIVSMDGVERLFSTLFALVLGGLALFFLLRAPRRLASPAHAWLAASLVALVTYFLAPTAVGDGDNINPRVLIFVAIATIMWFATFPLSRRTTAVVVGSALVISSGLTVLHIPKYSGFDRDQREYAEAGDHIPAGSTMIAVNLTIPTEERPGLTHSIAMRPVIQAAGYLVAERDVVDLSHFMGKHAWFIPVFRPEMNPFETIGRGSNWLADTTPDLDILGYPEATEGRGSVDFVLVWGANVAPDEVTSSPEVQDLFAQLDSGYDLAFTSSRGHVQLYELRDAP